MKKNYLKITPILFFLFLFLIGCRDDHPPKPEPSKKITTVEPVNINKINFYFENSGSMNGYLQGTNFRQSVAKIILNFKKDSVNTYFVNTKEHKTSNILEKIRENNISVGDIGNSDHKFIFTNAIKNARGNNLSIVITDGIYSMNSGKLNLADVEVDIENAFENALKVNEIETVVLKMSSNFIGQYYSESCHKKGGEKIDQERPYYILLFGNRQVINRALKDVVVLKDLEGFKEQARFFITKDMNVNYTVLTQGEEIEGKFRSSSFNSVVKEIEDAEKFSKSGTLLKDTYLQFGIAVDYSKLSIPESYLNDLSNYSIEKNSGYKVKDIKVVKNLNKNSKSFKWIDKLNEKGKLNYSHIIVVQGKTHLYDDLKMNLNINFPKWIKETGSDNDCIIKDDTNTTFAFDLLMNGISKAYKKVIKKDEFFKIKIKINP